VPDSSARQFLDTLFRDTITALHPARAVREVLDARDRDATASAPVHLIGLGKAAPAMCAAAVHWFGERRRAVVGGVCIAHDTGGVSVAPLPMILADHPVPGVRSHHAAAALGAYIDARVQTGEAVIVLLSGGASSLIGAPRDGMTAADYDATVAALIASGLSIHAINSQRRSLSRWGGGQLGLALTSRGAPVDVLVISDVIGDDLASIGSGPCVVPPGVQTEPIMHRIISNNAAARATLVSLAAARGTIASQVQEPLQGDVSHCADRIALALRTFASTARTGTVSLLPRVICWGGEPTVTLPGPDAPAGGRMQALSLLIAKQLHDAGSDAHGITVLAAGTDGRDGATDAAGAVIDARTWSAVRDAGRLPDRDLATYHSHHALRAIHATLPAFVSGTNVNDLVVAMIEREGSR
jgi:glycerate 2-kinase